MRLKMLSTLSAGRASAPASMHNMGSKVLMFYFNGR
jgi:hypothetical protein